MDSFSEAINISSRGAFEKSIAVSLNFFIARIIK